MAEHGITYNAVTKDTRPAADFQYTAQIGNKGTWSQADVDVSSARGRGSLHGELRWLRRGHWPLGLGAS